MNDREVIKKEVGFIGCSPVLGSETPIQHLWSIDDNVNHIYVKRDDLLPFSFGGNKARKATYFFREIDKGHYDSVVTYGSSSSNHCRIIANMCVARGLKCHIVEPEESSHETFNSKMMKLFGASFTTVPVQLVHDTIEFKIEELKKEGHNPYFIPGGGHGNLGTQAYVDCYNEIKLWEHEHNEFFDYIFLASGTGTTQAGLICGQLMHGDDRTIVGISVARRNPYGRNVVLDSIREYVVENGMDISKKKIQEMTVFCDDYIGNGYGSTTPEIDNVIRENLLLHGIPMDHTYVGKAFTGMKLFLERSSIQGKKVLFIHTGGTPLFFDDLTCVRV